MKTQKQRLIQAWRIRSHETEDECKQAKLVEWRGDMGLRGVGNRQQKQYIKVEARDDFPGGPVVKTSPSSAGSAGSIPGWGAEIPHVSRPKNQNIKQKLYCNKSDTLKMVNVKKKFLKKKLEQKRKKAQNF